MCTLLCMIHFLIQMSPNRGKFDVLVFRKGTYISRQYDHSHYFTPFFWNLCKPCILNKNQHNLKTPTRDISARRITLSRYINGWSCSFDDMVYWKCILFKVIENALDTHISNEKYHYDLFVTVLVNIKYAIILK